MIFLSKCGIRIREKMAWLLWKYWTSLFVIGAVFNIILALKTSSLDVTICAPALMYSSSSKFEASPAQDSMTILCPWLMRDAIELGVNGILFSWKKSSLSCRHCQGVAKNQ